MPPTLPRRCVVFLHEGLGSLALWKDFPRQLAHAAGCNALVYSRHGYGNSAPLREPRQPEFMHDEALVVLPALLDAAGRARRRCCSATATALRSR